jgi:hypothetical protein
MKVFEFYFNPRAKKDVVYDSFVYEPENIDKKRLGNLYIVGELLNTIQQDAHFLKNLAKIIEQGYYDGTNSEQGLRIGLKKANEFLGEEIKKGKVNWLGNLNLAVISFQALVLNFTKIGDIKILLLRTTDALNPLVHSEVEIMDIGTNLEFQNVTSSSSKIFGNIVSGKLSPEDKIIVLTKNAFELFKKNDLIKKISQAPNEKALKQIFKEKKQILSEISGICLLIFSLSSPAQNPSAAKKILLYLGKFRLSLPRFTLLNTKPFIERLGAAKRHLTGFTPSCKKLFVLILFLALILISGHFIFKGVEEQKLEPVKQALEDARAKVNQAENALIFKDEQRAEVLFQEALETISPFLEQKFHLQEEILFLQKSIEQGIESIDK